MILFNIFLCMEMKFFSIGHIDNLLVLAEKNGGTQSSTPLSLSVFLTPLSLPLSLSLSIFLMAVTITHPI